MLVQLALLLVACQPTTPPEAGNVAAPETKSKPYVLQ